MQCWKEAAHAFDCTRRRGRVEHSLGKNLPCTKAAYDRHQEGSPGMWFVEGVYVCVHSPCGTIVAKYLVPWK